MTDSTQKIILPMAGDAVARGGYVALWCREQAATVTVADEAGKVVDKLQVPAAGDRPGWGMLAQTRWSGVPGSEWQEISDGQWSRPVFLVHSWRKG